MSTFKKAAKSRVSKSKLPSQSPEATVNRAGGVAFEIVDPATKLITMTGGSFFAEPKFYSGTACVPKRMAGGKFDKLAERLAIVDGKLNGFAPCDELNDVAREVVATALDVARGKSPEDILAIANWLRNDANIRLTPQILLVLASRVDGTKSLVRKYAKSIAVRPDDVKSVLLAHRFFFGLKSLSNGLANGLSDAVARFGERGLMKYDSDDFPKWKDVLCWLPRKAGWPLKNEVAKYFITGEVVDASKTPIIAARKQLAKKTVFDAEAQALAKASMVNWEVLLSQFGSDKNAVWSFLIENDLVGYMAMLRNIRNLLDAKVSREVIQKVSGKLSCKEEVLKSRQLPFRFIAAKRAIESMKGTFDHADFGELLAAVELAANEACSNIPSIPGVTVVFSDNSGSMNQPVSGKSDISCADAANVLAGIVARVCDRGYVNAFADEVKEIRYSKVDTVLHIADKVAHSNAGGGTAGHKCVDWLMAHDVKPDRVIILSDMQMWMDHGGWGGQPFCDKWQSYLKAGKGNPWLHSVHLNGYGDSVVKPGDKVNQVAGFTEKIFTMLLQTEGVIGGKAIPTLDQIREKWTIK